MICMQGDSQRLYGSITDNIDGLVKNFVQVECTGVSIEVLSCAVVVQTDNKNKRMGGLCGLAATAVGLNTEVFAVRRLTITVLRCWSRLVGP